MPSSARNRSPEGRHAIINADIEVFVHVVGEVVFPGNGAGGLEMRVKYHEAEPAMHRVVSDLSARIPGTAL